MARGVVALPDFLVPARLTNKKKESVFLVNGGGGGEEWNRLPIGVYLVTYPHRAAQDT